MFYRFTNFYRKFVTLNKKTIICDLFINEKYCSKFSNSTKMLKHKVRTVFCNFLKYLEFSLNLSLFGKKIIKLLVEEILRCLIIFITF